MQSKSDSRQRLLKLNAKGKKAFSTLNNRATKEAGALLQRLSDESQQRLLHAMQTIEGLLEAKPKPSAPYLLRLHGPGDIGWIIHRHGMLYAEEYGFDETFEALAAEILVQFIKKHDPKRERIWIAEQDGERIGSVLIANAGDKVAQLRLLLVEPKARGKGLGKRFIHECFERIEEKPHTSFGHDLIAEIWELPLRG